MNAIQWLELDISGPRRVLRVVRFIAILGRTPSTSTIMIRGLFPIWAHVFKEVMSKRVLSSSITLFKTPIQFLCWPVFCRGYRTINSKSFIFESFGFVKAWSKNHILWLSISWGFWTRVKKKVYDKEKTLNAIVMF